MQLMELSPMWRFSQCQFFTGIAQGIQPLVELLWQSMTGQLKAVLKDAVVVALVLTAAIVAFLIFFNDGIVALFNKSGDPLLQSIAKEGITIYFLGFFPGSLNIVLAGYLSAMEKSRERIYHFSAERLGDYCTVGVVIIEILLV